MKTHIVILSLLLLSTVVFGDEIELGDGSRVEGTLVGQSKTDLRIKTSDKIESIPIEKLKSLIVKPSQKPNVQVDLTAIDPSFYPFAIARTIFNYNTANKCIGNCKSAKQGGLDWDVACVDYCDCLWRTNNSDEQCKNELKDTVGADPPFIMVPSQESQCSACTPLFSSVKTCVDDDALGSNEDLTAVVPCGQAMPASWNCAACFDALSLRKTCCIGGACGTQACSLSMETPLPLQ